MTIGILGGGQLGYMLALAGYPLGLHFRFFDPSPEAPVGRIASRVTADFSDEAALEKFASGLELVTYEFENVPVGRVSFSPSASPYFRRPPRWKRPRTGSTKSIFFRNWASPRPSSRPVPIVKRLDAAVKKDRPPRYAENLPHGLRRQRPMASPHRGRCRSRKEERTRQFRRRGASDLMRPAMPHSSSNASFPSPASSASSLSAPAPAKSPSIRSSRIIIEAASCASPSRPRRDSSRHPARRRRRRAQRFRRTPIRRRPRHRIFRTGWPPARQRNGPARPQLRSLDHRRRAHQSIRESSPRRHGSAARLHRTRSAPPPC